ncbi:DAPK1 [Branchiostoma lanceolatum]|nr:DAPK1 [Branchiostoma lanceolatum]
MGSFHTGQSDLTSLHVACWAGQTDVAGLLMKHGANLEARDKLQNTSLHGAAEQGHTETCEILIRSGADIMAVNVVSMMYERVLILTFLPLQYEKTPLQLAAEHGHTGTCELLIRSGADVMATIKTVCKKMIQEKSYHELLQTSDGVRVNRCKVAICGGEETGKTTLKMSLQKARVGEVSVWDFAGRSEYVVTHSMFMDVENTVFIVLYSIMDDRKTQERKVYWWLSFIKSCSPNRQPDVILVASHGDMVPVDQGQRNAAHLVHSLKAVFKDHLRIADEVILMDCRRTRTPEMGRLKTLLGSFKEALVEHQRDMPKLCAEIMKNLPKWSTTKTSYKFPVMKWPEYLDAVKEIDRFVTEDFLQQSTRFLHYLGEVLFITPSTCDPIVILAPNWLSTDIIGRMIVPENLEPQRKSPYVTKTEIQHVFQDVADVDLLITLLQEFQLCHSYDGQEFIFSWLLTETMPPYEWQTIPDPKARYFGKQVQCTDSTDMFSSGFFPRVQTRLMRELENRPKLWRDGAKCADRNVEGLIKLSPDGRAVNICVRSVQGDKVQCGKMLQQLENVVADVLDEWSPGTGVVEKVLSARALKEHTEEFHSYSHEVINKARTENSSIINPILGFKEQVKDLLCREDEDPLTKNRTELIQALRVVGPILDSLLSRGVLSVEECDIIRSKFTPHDRARMLLDILMTKGEEARLIFLCILKDVSPDVRLSTSKALKREVVKRKQQPCANQKFSKEEIVEMTKDSETNLSVGAFGTVYRAKLQCHHQMNGREVAIKVYSPGVDNQQGREELFQELAMRGSSHPHLLPLLGTCDVDG